LSFYRQSGASSEESMNTKVYRLSYAICTAGALWMMTSGCGGTAGAKQPIMPGHQYIVGIDLSASRSRQAIDESRRLLDDLVETRLGNGDQLVLIEMYGGATSSEHQWMDTVASMRSAGKFTPLDRRKLDEFKQEAHQVVDAIYKAAATTRTESTDILGTLTRASDYARAGAGRRSTIVLLSDMENSTSEVEMARGVPAHGWIAERKAANRLPDLTGVCVVISGAAGTTAHGAKIRTFWSEYFNATGAQLPDGNYREFIPVGAEVHC
jgi:hypothetical protein